MFRKQNEEKESSLALHSAWKEPTQFKQLVLLSDEIHLAAIQSGSNTIQIWNIQSQQCICEMTPLWVVNAMALLKDGNLVIADDLGNIYQLKFDIQTQKLEILDIFNTMKNKSTAMTVLENGSLITGHQNGSITIWNLTAHKKIASFTAGRFEITALDTRLDGSLLVGSSTGKILIHDWMTTINLINGSSTIKCLIALPDNTIIYGDDKGFLNRWSIKEDMPFSLKISETAVLELISMPNGLIACSTIDGLQLFETSFIRNYVKTDAEIKKTVVPHLPETVTNLVADYVNTDLFKHPKQPHQKESVLTAFTSPKLHSA